MDPQTTGGGAQLLSSVRALTAHPISGHSQVCDSLAVLTDQTVLYSDRGHVLVLHVDTGVATPVLAINSCFSVHALRYKHGSAPRRVGASCL